MPDATAAPAVDNPTGVNPGVENPAMVRGGSIPGQQPENAQPAQNRRRGGSPASTAPNNPEDKHPLASSTQKSVPAKGPTASYEARHFKDSVTGLPATDAQGRMRTEGVIPSETVEFGMEVVDGLRGFATVYVQKLIELQNIPIKVGGKETTVYEAMKAQQGRSVQHYSEDEYMIGMFSKLNEQTGLRAVKTAEEINALITNHPQVIQNLMLSAERYARDGLAAAGLRVEMVDYGHRTDLDRTARMIRTTAGQGSVRGVVDRIANWWNSPNNAGERGAPGHNHGQDVMLASALGASAGGAVGGLAGLAVGGGLEGAIVGGTAAALAGIPLGPLIGSRIDALWREGVGINIAEDASVATQAQRRGEYLRSRYMFGINPGDLAHSEGVGRAVDQAIRIVYLRAEYMKSLGVPAQEMDALSDQFLNVPGQRPEEIDDKTRNEVTRIFDEELHGWNAGLTPEKQRDLFRKAQEIAMVRRWEMLEKQGINASTNHSQRLKDAIAARTGEGAAITARTKDATEEKRLLGTDRAALTTVSSSISEYQTRLTAADTKRRELQLLISSISRGGVGPAGDYAAAIKMLDEAISAHGVAETLIPNADGKLTPISALFDKHTDLTNEMAAAKGAARVAKAGETPEQTKERSNEEIARIPERYQPRFQEITDLRRKVEAVKTRLQTLQENASSVEQQALTSEQTISGAKTLTDVRAAYDRIAATIMGPFAPDYAGIMHEMNIANNADPNAGWPESENNNAGNRLLVRQALIQLRTDGLMRSPAIPGFADLELSYETITTAPVARRITAEQLRTMTVDELVALDARLAGVAPITPIDDLDRAKQWANAQLDFTGRAIQEENQAIQNAENVQDRLIGGVSLDNERAQLEMVQGFDDGRANIKARATAAVLSGRRQNLEDGNPVAADAIGFTASEIASGLPRNVLEMIDILTGYQNSADRNGEFEKIWRTLGNNPDLLVRFLDESFRNKLEPAPTIIGPVLPISQFSTRLATTLQRRRISTSEFDRSTNGVVDQFVNWSTSI